MQWSTTRMRITLRLRATHPPLLRCERKSSARSRTSDWQSSRSNRQDDLRLHPRRAADVSHAERRLLRLSAAAPHRRSENRRAQSRCDGRWAMKRWLPWIVAAIFAAAFLIVLVAKRGGGSNEMNGVTQDASGRRVVAWVDPMYSQGPPHLYKSNHPGIAPDCGMKLVPPSADETTPTTA